MSTSVAVGFVVGMGIGFLLIACLAVEYGVLLQRVDRLDAHVRGEPPAPRWTAQLRLRWLALLERRRERRDDPGLDEWLDDLHRPDAVTPEPDLELDPKPDLKPELKSDPMPDPKPRPRPALGPPTEPAHALITPEAITGGGRHRAVGPGQPRTADRQAPVTSRPARNTPAAPHPGP